MILQIPKCSCGKYMKIIHFGVEYDKDHSTWVNLEMCPKCRVVKVSHEQLKEWFSEKGEK